MGSYRLIDTVDARSECCLGCISQTLTYPFDVLRRKMQVSGMQGGSIKYRGAIDALRSILRVEGISGLYRGLWPNLRKFLNAM